VCYRLGTVNFGFTLDAFRRDLVGPGEKHHNREPQGYYQHDGLHDPFRCADVLQHQVCRLCQQPAGYDIAKSYAEYISMFELIE